MAEATLSIVNGDNKQFLFNLLQTMLKILLPLVAVAVLAGCSTPQSRAQRNPELLASLPPEVQERVQRGEIDIGDSQEVVRVALGKPDRRYTELTEAGRTEVWAYHDRSLGSRLSLGVGTGIGIGRGSVFGGGVSVGTGGRMRSDEKVRVSFVGGEAVAIQTAER